ncbi:21927_t:CDS:2, partial [Racocetra persica]
KPRKLIRLNNLHFLKDPIDGTRQIGSNVILKYHVLREYKCQRHDNGNVFIDHMSGSELNWSEIALGITVSPNVHYCIMFRNPVPPSSDISWDFRIIPKRTRIYPGRSTPTTGRGLHNLIVSILVREVFYDPPNPPPTGYSSAIPTGLTINPGTICDIDLYDIQQMYRKFDS